MANNSGVKMEIQYDCLKSSTVGGGQNHRIVEETDNDRVGGEEGQGENESHRRRSALTVVPLVIGPPMNAQGPRTIIAGGTTTVLTNGVDCSAMGPSSLIGMTVCNGPRQDVVLNGASGYLQGHHYVEAGEPHLSSRGDVGEDTDSEARMSQQEQQHVYMMNHDVMTDEEEVDHIQEHDITDMQV